MQNPLWINDLQGESISQILGDLDGETSFPKQNLDVSSRINLEQSIVIDVDFFYVFDSSEYVRPHPRRGFSCDILRRLIIEIVNARYNNFHKLPCSFIGLHHHFTRAIFCAFGVPTPRPPSETGARILDQSTQ